MINDFIDGMINPDDEDQLFSKLFYDKKFRGDFKQFIEIDRLPDHESFNGLVPENVTANVFDEIQIPIYQKPGLSGKFIGFITNYKQGLLSSLATAAFMLLLLFNGNNTNTQQFVESGTIVNNFQAIELKNLTPPAISIAIPDEDMINENKISMIKSFEDEKSENVLSDSDNDKSIPVIASSYQQKQFSSYHPNRVFEKPELHNSGTDYSPYYNDFVHQSSFFDDGKLSIELSGQYADNFKRELVSYDKDSFFDNTIIGFRYKLKENKFIGIEFRKENYYLDYQGKLNGRDYHFYQNTDYWSYNAYFQAGLLQIGKFDFYSRLGIGANRIGGIGRVSAGIEYNHSAEYSMFFGFELNSLVYKQQNITFLSSKYGLYYGLRLGL